MLRGKNFFLSFSLLVLSLLLVGGCKAKKTDSSLVIVGWPGPEGAALEKVVEKYNAEQGKEDKVDAKVIYFSREGTVEKLAASLAAETMDYDIFTGNNFIVGRFTDFIQPIDEAFGPDLQLFRGAFSESLVKLQSIGGELSGFPTDISLHFLYYREDLIEQLLSDSSWQARYREISREYLGKTMEALHPDQWTWEDYLASALFFTQSINPDSPVRYGTVLQLKNLIYNLMIWNGMLASEGGQWYDESGRVAIDSPATRKALKLYKDIVDSGASPGASGSYEFGEANAAFGSGQVAFMIQWNAAVNMLKDASEYPDTANFVGVTHQPRGAAGIKTHMHGITLALNKFAPHREEALKFYAYLTTPEAIRTYVDAGGATPNSAVISEVAVDKPELLMMSEHADKYGMVMAGSMDENGEKIFESLAENFTSYWNNDISMDEAIAKVAASLEAYR